ncbi:MAG TPA: peptide ABC transporter substrate-binding protein [Longimicrobiales bacterium]|nr:peptide ABC transporter substrate-binding protein [Longimicrobiales bacterium]
MMRSTRAVLCCGLLTTGLPACGDTNAHLDNAAAGDAQSGGLAVICMLSRPDVLNSFASPERSAADLRPVLFTPVVLYDSSGGFRPHLASGWQWSDDRRSLRLRVRDDLRWHDGTPVTAEDVAWTLRTAADSAYGYLGRAELGEVESATAGEGVVDVVFREPAGEVLEPLARLPILPKHILDSIPADGFQRASYHREPVGSGPFRFAGRLPDGSVQLDRNPDYPHDLGTPLLDRVVLREVPEPSAILVELNTNGADACIVGSSVAKDAAAGGSTILPIVPVGALAIAVDNRKPPFDDVRVRRALSATLDRAEIAHVVSPASAPARNFLPDASLRWRDTTLVQPDRDSTLAAALLDSAGWRTGPQGRRTNAAGQPLRFTIFAPPPLQPLLTVVQAQFRRIGAEVELQLVESSVFIASLGDPARRPAALAIIVVPDRIAVPDPYSEFHSASGYNLASYNRPEVDSIVERLRDVIPDSERGTLYRELQRYVAQDVPIIYTVHTPRVLAVRPRLRGVHVDANGPFTHAAEWWIPVSERRR